MTQNQNNNVPYIIIILLLIVIAVLAFFLGRSHGNPTWWTTTSEKLTVTVVDDKRCNDCNTSALVSELQTLPFLANATIDVKDFSDAWVENMINAAGISKLPAIIFSHNKINDYSFLQYLSATNDGKYQLATWANFDPYAKRSERWFLFLDEDTLTQVTQGLHFSGNEDAEILWMEYSDLWCGACQQFHTSGITEAALKAYPENLSKAMVGFLSVGWPTSLNAMKSIECMASQKPEVHFTAWENFYKTGSYGENNLSDFAKENGINVDTYTSCISSSEVNTKIENEKNNAINIFGITGTPGNVLLNKKTGEYISAGWDIEAAVANLLTE